MQLPVQLQAGVAAVDLDPPIGIDMMGYGARTGKARGLRDPLRARALHLVSGAVPLLLVELDVCLLSPGQADAARARIAARTGVAPERVLLGCIHTHSGPETGYGAWLTGGEPPAHATALFDAAVEAAARAVAGAVPARLGIGTARARIGRNRRRAGGPLDPEILVARVDRADGTPLAVLYVHGCHPTALGHENLDYSADWPGAASRAIEVALPGATALFALGAHADVDPRTRGLLDLAIEDQSLGVGFDEMEALGREVGEAVAAAAGAIETDGAAEIAASETRVAIPVHGAEAGEAARRASLERQRGEAARALGLADSERPGILEWFALTHARTRSLPRDEARRRIAIARRYLRDRTAPRFAGSLQPEVCVQVLRLGDAWLLGLPLEATVDVGLEWKRRLAGRAGSVVSIANGWLRYLPHPRQFEESGAGETYEVVMSTLIPDAATRLVDAADALRERLLADS
ncbi:MAG: neutral/alkaline non-lysosomal ceramidase N-terminal domain-containing protein [Myxococcota bacterium]|nr:neutral/alkaline non-lysosomal ceramidase N-terminal domain-containing protein [Myxococcota bacterium]